MPWQNNIGRLIGKPVGVSFRNGTGTSGVLCGADRNTVYVTEYLYQDQFATKHYPANTIRDINSFPPCGRRQRPVRPNRPILY